ncbi:amidase, partial [Phenoliferia sp. Uapishka_3]
TLNLLSASLESIIAHLQAGNVTSLALVDAYLAAIERDNEKGLELRAVIDVAQYKSGGGVEGLKELAERMDRERSGDGMGKPLWGVPILVKDNCATDPSLGMNTTAGSYALLGSKVPRDAHIIHLLRQAGAIILGKTNLSEWANYKGNIVSRRNLSRMEATGELTSNFGARRKTNGWSARGGQTQSAYVVGGFSAGGDPCGSSSGSGVAISAGWAAVSIGTETDGSIICPSNRAALYGIKPTVGLASRAGIIPISSTQDSPGPMAKSAYDAALILSIISGFDPRDHATKASKGHVYDYTKSLLGADGFNGLRLGVPRELFFNDTLTGNDPEINIAIDAALEKIAQLGGTIISPTSLPSTLLFLSSPSYESPSSERIVLDTDFKIDLALYLSSLSFPAGVPEIRTLEDVIVFNDKNRELEFEEGECCQEILVRAQGTGGRGREYEEAKKMGREMGARNGTKFAQHYLPTFMRAHTFTLRNRLRRGGELAVWTSLLQWLAPQPSFARWVRESSDGFREWIEEEILEWDRAAPKWEEIAEDLKLDAAAEFDTAEDDEWEDEDDSGDTPGLSASKLYDAMTQILFFTILHSASSPSSSSIFTDPELSLNAARQSLMGQLYLVDLAWTTAKRPYFDDMKIYIPMALDIAWVFDGQLTPLQVLEYARTRTPRCWDSCEVRRMEGHTDGETNQPCVPSKLKACAKCKIVRFVSRASKINNLVPKELRRQNAGDTAQAAQRRVAPVPLALTDLKTDDNARMVITQVTHLSQLDEFTTITFTALDLATALGVADPNVVLDDAWIQHHLVDEDNTADTADAWFQLTGQHVDIDSKDRLTTKFAQHYLPTFMRAHTFILRKRLRRGGELVIWSRLLEWLAPEPSFARWIRSADEVVREWIAEELMEWERVTPTWEELWDDMRVCTVQKLWQVPRTNWHRNPSQLEADIGFITAEDFGEDYEEPLESPGLSAQQRFKVSTKTLLSAIFHSTSSPTSSSLFSDPDLPSKAVRESLARQFVAIKTAWKEAESPYIDDMHESMGLAGEIAAVLDSRQTPFEALDYAWNSRPRCWGSCEVKRRERNTYAEGGPCGK